MTPVCLCLSLDNKRLFVTDRENHLVQVLNKEDGTFIQTIGNGKGAGPGYFNSPEGVCISPDGSELYVADRYNNRINVFNPIDGSYVCRLVGRRLVDETRIFLEEPRGICISADGELLYVADFNGVQVLSVDGAHIRTINVQNPPARWDEPHFPPVGLCLSRNNDLLFVTTYFGDIVVFRTSDDTISTRFDIWVHRGPASSNICLSPDGEELYISQTRYDFVQVLRIADGSLIQRIGEYGQTAGKMFGPQGVCVSPDGEMFVADTGNYRVQVFQI